MNIILQSSIHALSKSECLLKEITDNQLSDHSVPPYFSCIGSHVRHILDFYDCILDGMPVKKIDLTNRKRDERLHGDSSYALKHLERIINAIHNIDADSLNQGFLVTDDLGLGCVTIEYKLGAILAQANSHTIHHYAIINYILDRLNIEMEDDSFGYNPTTPKQVEAE
jgi:hypothetical protein